MIDYLLLADSAFHQTPDWRVTLHKLRENETSRFQFGLESWKASMMTGFNAPRGPAGVLADLRRMNSLMQLLPEAGRILLTGSDYLESVMNAYLLVDAKAVKRVVTEHLYRGLRSLMSDQTKSMSLLLDQLYFLQAENNRQGQSKRASQPNILSSLLCTTSFLKHLARDVSVLDTQRGRGQIEALTAYREQVNHLHPPPTVRKSRPTKGKGKAKDHDDVHIHQAAQISQVHELFPTFSNTYIMQLLDYFDNDPERVVAALLEPDSLPSHLREPPATASDAVHVSDPLPDLAPRSTPPLPPQRRNVFDDDQFDRLKISSKQFHRGQKQLSIDEEPTKDEHTRSKAAIMAALAAFDSDDDERDDTYDVADVGGTVDQSVDTDSRPRGERAPEQNPHEGLLFRAWRDNHELFARDSKTRVSPVRQDLKRQTGLSDEQIEGWAVVLSRDAKLQYRLQKKYSNPAMLSGSQRALEQTKWQRDSSRDASADESEGFASDRPNDPRRMGQAQIRGNRNWGRGRGRGGSAAGAADDPATQAARRRKEQGRGRGRGHKEGRARKMGRGMAGPTGQ